MGITAFVALLCIILSIVPFMRYKSMLYSRYENQITGILQYVAGDIDVDDLAECMRTGEESEKFLALQEELDHLRDRVDIHFIYVIVPLNTEPTDNIKNVIAGVSQYEYENMADQLVQLNQLTGDSYSPETAKKYLDAYNSGQLSFFEESSQWGDDYTGLLPLFDSQGNRVAALCVDVDVAQIHSTLRQNTISVVAVILLLGVIFEVLLYFWTAKNVTRPIEQLEESVTSFADSCRDQTDPAALQLRVPEIHTDNEIGSLSAAVIKMSEAMQDYVKNIQLHDRELARLTVQANRDALTGVRNKFAYDAYAAEVLSEFRKDSVPFAMLMADVDQLKKINDTYGHDKGDLFIRKSCDILCEIFCHSPVFRIGGDEFVVILQGQDYQQRADLLKEAGRRFSDLAADQTLEPWERCSVTVGIAEADWSSGQTIDELLALADKDMYKNKHAKSVKP